MDNSASAATTVQHRDTTIHRFHYGLAPRLEYVGIISLHDTRKQQARDH